MKYYYTVDVRYILGAVIHLLVRSHDSLHCVSSLDEEVLGGGVGLGLLTDGGLLHLTGSTTQDRPGYHHHTWGRGRERGGGGGGETEEERWYYVLLNEKSVYVLT